MSSCPACGQRKARRACPALGQTICTVCCATKRLTEIACPSHCTFLASAREHPAAIVRKQQEQDVGLLLPAIRHLTERQHQLFFVFNTAITRHAPDGFARLSDSDVAEAADAVAATLETAARGVIYEQLPSSLVAQRLARDIQTVLSQIREQGATVYDREAAIALRAIAYAAREVGSVGAGYLGLIGRLLQMNRAAARPGGPGAPSPAGSGAALAGTAGAGTEKASAERASTATTAGSIILP